ncbi:hypothetical protein GCM10010082_16860 [Kushneria pakistanensis]|uniref:Uncharacterized protein n=1 Tax=Kushneria pakistanensis TaxID=1508770 RepID=A0ABQ3FI52_9GAMM|nr:hypothetical protein [Kushneria pakistanensis]GHC24800.1 hypothetical protein GCM10010082_16860 [Kushneria pakistanensis]
MRPLDILSITLVLCAMALVIALPMTDNKATLSSDASLTHGTTLHYPGQQQHAAALLQFEGDQAQSQPMLFDPDREGRNTLPMQNMPVPGLFLEPETPAPSMSMRYPTGRQIYSF